MKYDSRQFKALVTRLIEETGYSIRLFCEEKKLSRDTLMRAMRGDRKPKPESIESWCHALQCSPDARKALYKSVGYYTPEELAMSVA